VSNRRRVLLSLGIAALAGALVACSSASSSPLPPDGFLPLGNWGGDSSAMIVGDTAMHLHISCTYGDVSGRIVVDTDGSFDVAGSYMLRAYPVAVGPSVPARFVGHLNGASLTVSAIVNDTIQHTTVTRGPVTVKLNADPKLLPCPICRRPIVSDPLRRARRGRGASLGLGPDVSTRRRIARL
jgi:hypothetical protein